MVQLQRLEILFKKYFDKTINSEEREELAVLIGASEEGTILEVFEKAWKDYAGDGTVLAADRSEAIIDRVMYQPEKGRLVTLQPRGRYRWIRYAVAAAILFVIVTGAYLAFFHKTEKASIAKTPVPTQNDLQPGGNKALLTLDGGKTLVLDNAKNGALAVQGNTQITKEDGALSYNEQQQVGIAQNPVYNSVSTPKGGQYQLTLADGSKVWLNAASSIRFPTAFTGNERRVEITGEVYFEVVHDASKPFHVSVNGMDVQVLGTHFNINAYSDEESIRTTLLEGSVKVRAANESVTIKPGEQAQMNLGNAIGFTVFKNINLDQVMAWKNGEFNFDNVDLQTIMRQLARWYDVEVVYATAPPPHYTCDGEIGRNLSLTTILKHLERKDVHFQLEGKRLIVSR